MYYQRLLLLFPSAGAGGVAGWYIVLMFAGMLLLVAGARLHHGIITLGFVAGGAIIGKLLPGLMGWKLDPMATTCALAFAAGIFGYLTHRWITGIGLSLLVVTWVVLGFWMNASQPSRWAWPTYPGGTAAFLPYLQALKGQLGTELATQIGPFAAVALLAALAFYTLLPRLATILFWILAGVTLIIFSGLAYTQYHSAALLQRLPSSIQGQTLVVGALVSLGLVCQSIRRKPRAAPPEEIPSVQPMPA